MAPFSWSKVRSSSSSKRGDAEPLKPGVSYGSSTASSSTESGSDTDTDPDEVDLGFSFSGGGWLMIYMYGVAKALREGGAHRNARFIGASSGALTAMGLHLDADFDVVSNVAIEEYVPMARASVRGAFRMREYVHLALLAVEGVDHWAKTQTHPRTCQVVYTSLSAMKSRRKSTFESQDDLVNGLLASCTATPIAGFPFKYDGEWVMDGGVLDNQPLFKEDDGVRRTVTVTPNAFDWTADIKPSQYIPPWWSLYPPPQDDMRWLFSLGYQDGLDWCHRNGYATVIQSVASTRRTAQTPESQPHMTPYETVLGQVTGYPFYEKVGKAFSITDRNSIFMLLILELALRKLIEIVVASLDAVMVLWTAIVVAGFFFMQTPGPVEAWTTESAIIVAVYLCVCVIRVWQEAQEIKNTTTWLQVDTALDEVKRIQTTTSKREAHGVKALKGFHTQLAKSHHDVLVDNSLLYRISTMIEA